MASLIIRPRSRIFHGHDWVYATEILKVTGTPADGDVVGLKDGRDRPLGSAIYNSKSRIVARRFSRRRQDLDAEFFERRIRQALELRERWGVDPRACRVVWSESDGLPGLIVDRYEDQIVLQTLTLGMDRRKDLIVGALERIFQPGAVIERNDAAIRSAEGLPLVAGVLRGEARPVEVALAGVRFAVNPAAGHKTGLYLDQGDNYALVAAHARGRRVLDCFSNQGGFALACAAAGAAAVTAVESSPDCCAAIRDNAARNGLDVRVVEANVFDFLKAETARGAEYDLVVLDPPSFTRTRERLQDALRGYKEIHLRAAALLPVHGLLATFCCSHHVSREDFAASILAAMVDARRTVRRRAICSQRADHPVLLGIPESEYLKGFLFEAVPGR